MEKDTFDLPNTLTRSGLDVCNVQYEPRNDLGNGVTFPIKGSIFRPRRQAMFQIWTEIGELMLGEQNSLDIIITKEMKAIMDSVGGDKWKPPKPKCFFCLKEVTKREKDVTSYGFPLCSAKGCRDKEQERVSYQEKLKN